MSNIIDLNKNNVTFTTDDKIIIDTNIFIFLFYPMGNYQYSNTKRYSRIYKKILSSKAKILVPAFVISEFINVCLKFEFALRQDENPNIYKNYKKDFRGKPEYEEALNKIKLILKENILNNSIIVNDEFNKINLEEIFKNKDFDFNDLILLEIAKMNNCKILTNDSDFKKYINTYGVEILTYNKIND